MQTLDANPEETIIIGDTKFDIIGGKEVGISTLGVLWGFGSQKELLENGADLLADSPNLILKNIRMNTFHKLYTPVNPDKFVTFKSLSKLSFSAYKLSIFCKPKNHRVSVVFFIFILSNPKLKVLEHYRRYRLIEFDHQQ